MGSSITAEKTDKPHLQLLLPGLLAFGASKEDGRQVPRLAALEKLLVRADVLPLARGFEALLCSLFGAETPDDGDLPIAAITRVLDLGIVDNGWWLRADPVHLSARRDQLILTDSHTLDLTQEEANRLAAEIVEAYTADGWVLKSPRPSRWYLKPPHAPKVTTTPLPDVAGRDIHPYLPRGPEAKAWHTTLNEMQILLHSSKVNEERERAGKLPINSLWFWGGGRLPRIQPVRWGELWSTEPVSLALARLTETPSQSPPAGFDDWRANAPAPGGNLIVVDGLRPAALQRDFESWSQTLLALERNWFQPLLAALDTRAIDSAAILTDTGTAFRLEPGRRQRWWRRRKPLAAYR